VWLRTLSLHHRSTRGVIRGDLVAAIIGSVAGKPRHLVDDRALDEPTSLAAHTSILIRVKRTSRSLCTLLLYRLVPLNQKGLGVPLNQKGLGHITDLMARGYGKALRYSLSMLATNV